jgi:hypothetical protein
MAAAPGFQAGSGQGGQRLGEDPPVAAAGQGRLRRQGLVDGRRPARLRRRDAQRRRVAEFPSPTRMTGAALGSGSRTSRCGG